MAKYRDKFNAGESGVCPKDKAEHPKARHERRLDTNLACRQKLQHFCMTNGFRFNIKNEGHHWQIWLGDWQFDWWPSTAKLIINQQWKKGMHAHDYQQITHILKIAKLLKE